MTTKISPEMLAKLNHTNNLHLIEYRKKNIIKILFTNSYNNFKIHIFSLLAGGDIKKSYQRRNALDKLWIISLLNEYKKDLLLSEGFGRKVPLWNGFRFCVIDRKIAPVVFALNKIGVQTNNSCEGNQETGHSWTAYISTSVDDKLPKELIDYLIRKNVRYSFNESYSEYVGNVLHAKNAEENKIFVEALTDWAKEKGINDIDESKYFWRI